MKNLLLHTKIIFLGFLMAAPFTLLASNSGKVSELNSAFQLQVKTLDGDTSGSSLNINSTQNSGMTELPKIQLSNPFPNPASSFVNINYRFPSANDNGELKIMDLTGKTVKTYPLNGTNNTLRINIRDLNRGMYFCTIYFEGQLVKSNKLIVSNR